MKARLDFIDDATIDVAQQLLVPGELIAEHMRFIVDFFFKGLWTYTLHIYHHPWSHRTLRMFTDVVSLWTKPLRVNYSFEKIKIETNLPCRL